MTVVFIQNKIKKGLIGTPWTCVDTVGKTPWKSAWEKSFSEQHTLTRHKKREACVVVTFECDFCEESFTNKQKLRQHLKSHNIHFPEFSVTCDTCGHTFLTQEGMVKHVNRHHAGIFPNSKKEWNFACEKCERRFVFEEELRTHLKDVHKVRDGETSENHSLLWS